MAKLIKFLLHKPEDLSLTPTIILPSAGEIETEGSQERLLAREISVIDGTQVPVRNTR